MAIRGGKAALGLLAASLFGLAGCGSGSSGSATTASSAASTTSSAPASGGDQGSLDADSVTWFETMCTGVAPLGSLEQTLDGASTSAELSSAMAEVGESLTSTASQLSELPPPNVEDGEQLAKTVIDGLDQFGTTFSDFSVRAADLKEGDTAAQQQFITDFQAAVSTSPLVGAEPSADVQAEVKKIPACQDVFGS